NEADGTPRETDVIRIGGFVAMADGQYLNYLPSVGKLAVLPRQPPRNLMSIAKGIASADGKGEYVEAAIDPSRGALLQMIVQRPNFIERIRHGEGVNYVIILVGAIGIIVSVFQAFYLLRTRVAVRRQLANLDRPVNDNPLGRVLNAMKTDPANIEEDA